MYDHPQQILDATGTYEVRGRVSPSVPLFCRDGMRLRGMDRGAMIALGDNYAATAVVTGWPRGLVDDGHYPTGGFRTRGDAHLTARGTSWDQGPYPGGWATVKKLRIICTVTRYGASWDMTPIAGMYGLGTPRRPEPWFLFMHDGMVRLRYTLLDGTTYEHSETIDTTATTLLLDVTLDLEAAHGVGVRFCPNTLWPFGLGAIPPAASGGGYELANPQDVTISRFEVWTNDTQLGYVAFGDGRPATYRGGDSLPLVGCSAQNGSRWLWAVSKNQSLIADAASVSIEDLQISGYGSNPAVIVGPLLGGRGFRAENMVVVNGSRAVQSAVLGVQYPITLEDCRLEQQGDCGVWLFGASGVTMNRVACHYARRTCGEFVDSAVSVEGRQMIAPPGTAQAAVFIQHGGTVSYREQVSDVEYAPGPEAFLKVYPTSFLGTNNPTWYSVEDCLAPNSTELVKVMPRPSWYTGVLKGRVDQAEHLPV